MPRQIIDTESGRPAYRRRLALRWVIVAVLLLAAVLVAFRLWQNTRPRLPAAASFVQENRLGYQNPGPGSPRGTKRHAKRAAVQRREHAA